MASETNNFRDMEWNQLALALRKTIRRFFNEDEVQRYLGEASCNARAQNEECLYPAFKKHLERALKATDSQIDSNLPLFPETHKLAPYVVYANCGSTYDGARKTIRNLDPNVHGRSRYVRPNFIVHVPGSNRHNLIAIEIRKSDQQYARKMIYERLKMVGCTKAPLNYRFAMYLCIGTSGVASNQIYALLVRRNGSEFESVEYERALAKQIDQCYQRLNGSAANRLQSEAEMAKLQKQLGFQDVTDHLLSPGIERIPDQLVRFAVAT